MDFLHIVVLALIQGLTEFLPISSSAHLVLPKELLGWPDQGLAFDVAVHVGSLAAVMIYFRKDVWQLSTAWLVSLKTQKQTENSRLAWFVFLATIPAGLAGIIFNDFVEAHLRSMSVIMITTIVFGLYLAWADYRGKQNIELGQITLLIAMIIGVSQALALIPGTSRSGITIAVALAFGLQREAAAKFSFLLSIPLIGATGVYKALELANGFDTQWSEVLLGASIAGVSAYLCIHFFLSFIQRIGMMPFVIYRLVLGLFLAGILISRL
ncbi:undecaprenyl-diphosphate phosphatase [Aurantivibrio infirmus]